jgi:DNA-binding beta-propeller fold protein YncE
MAVGENALWVAESFDDRAARIDPATNQVTGTIPGRTQPTRYRGRRDTVWVANSNDQTVSRIDPRIYEVESNNRAPGRGSRLSTATSSSIPTPSTRGSLTTLFPSSSSTPPAPTT